MISIAEAISDLLFVRDTVVVPGLGAFVKSPVSAKVNPVANYFTMPTCEIRFDANLREDNDLIVSYMSEKNGISEEEARRMLAMFVSDCFNSLKDGEAVKLAKVGKLFYDWHGDLDFEQDKAINHNADAFGLCDISPEPVLRSKTKEEIKVEIAQQQKDKNTPMTVDEEVVRLKSHIKAMEQELEKGGAVGRKLDFIAQEMNREANTILSKSTDLSTSNVAIDLKTDIEKVREQIQNIE